MSTLLDLIMQRGINYAVESMLEVKQLHRKLRNETGEIEFRFFAKCGEIERFETITWQWAAYDSLGEYDTGRDTHVEMDAYRRMEAAMRHRIYELMISQVNFSAPEAMG